MGTCQTETQKRIFLCKFFATSRLTPVDTAHRCQYLSVFCLIKTFCQYFKRAPLVPPLWPAVAIVSAFVFIDNMQMSRFVCAGNANPMHMKYLSQTITPERERERAGPTLRIRNQIACVYLLCPSLSFSICIFRGLFAIFGASHLNENNLHYMLK